MSPLGEAEPGKVPSHPRPQAQGLRRAYVETRQPEPTAEGSQGRRFYLVNFCLRRLLNKRLKQPLQHQVPVSGKQSCSHYLKPVPPGHNQPQSPSDTLGSPRNPNVVSQPGPRDIGLNSPTAALHPCQPRESPAPGTQSG